MKRIIDFFAELLRTVNEIIVSPYVPDPNRPHWSEPERFEAETPKPKRKEKQLGKVHKIDGRRFLETDEDGLIEWTNITTRTISESEREADLTDRDETLLLTAGLDLEKAELIKPFWAMGQSNATIVELLNGDVERYGLQKRTVEKYTAVFSRALSSSEPPPE